MRVSELKVIGEPYSYEDDVLLAKIRESGKNAKMRKKAFDKVSADYLDKTVARLAYSFAREKHDSLVCEAFKRGLVIA